MVLPVIAAGDGCDGSSHRTLKQLPNAVRDYLVQRLLLTAPRSFLHVSTTYDIGNVQSEFPIEGAFHILSDTLTLSCLWKGRSADTDRILKDLCGMACAMWAHFQH